ncbi:MAG: hypothetical protein WBG90_16710 [Saonia sp.]
MKNVTQNSLVQLFAFVMCLSFISCGERKKEGDDEPKEDPIVIAPAQIIDVKQAKHMYDDYTKRRVPLIKHYEDSINRYDKKSKDTFDVARYTYYDYKTIKQYLAFIEQEAKKANVEISTLRFYLSNYPDKEHFEHSKRKIKHPRQNSIFIMPTIKRGDREFGFYTTGGEKDRTPVLLTNKLERHAPNGIGALESEGYRAHASFIPAILKPNANAPSAFNGDQSFVLNEGSSVPPPH